MVEQLNIIGGGQLGRMITQDAKRLSFQVAVLEENPPCPAAQVGAEQVVGNIRDEEDLREFLKRTGVFTWEIEHTLSEVLEDIYEEEIVDIQPHPRSLSIIRDKLRQKQFLDDIGIPVGPFSEELSAKKIGPGPYVVKKRFQGYDGRGNLVTNNLDPEAAIAALEDDRLYVEKKLDFDRELAVIIARNTLGHIAVYPIVETVHVNSICHTVTSPANVPKHTAKKAEEIARTTLSQLEGAGIFAIEMFDVNGEVLVNEIAPRVHNSGHLTIEGNHTSQFEQHVRAITGLPLGSTERRAAAAVMINILGSRVEPLNREGIDKVLALPDTHLHFYGKSPRPERKIGHITVLASNTAEALERAQAARSYLRI